MYIYIKKLRKDKELTENIDIPLFLKKIIIKFIKIFNIITVKKIDETHYLYIIPKENIKKIQKIINKNIREKVILSKELKKYENEINLKSDKKIKYFINEILEYIMKKSKKELQLQNLYILVNEYNEKNLNIIMNLIDKVKTVNIVTESVKKYNILEEKIYNNQGILITVSNNKNKALKRAELIINLDYNNEYIKAYKINRTATIINCNNEKIQMPYFQGVIINNVEIDIEEKEEYQAIYEEFEKIDIYTSYKNATKGEEKQIKILNMIGNNGIINEKEFVER